MAVRVSVILVGIFLRLYKLQEFATFGHDNSRDLILLYKLHKYGEMIWRGPVFSIVWADLSPLYYYILYPFYLVAGFYPLAPAIVTTLFNIAALISIVYVSAKLFGEWAAFVSGMIYGVSFLVIKEGAFGLNPALIPVFSVWLFYAVYNIFEGRGKYLILLAFTLAMLVSFHPSGFFIIPILLLLFIFLRENVLIDKKTLGLSSLIFFIFAIIPYAIQEKKTNGWNIKQILKYFHEQGNETGLGITEYARNFYTVLKMNIVEAFLPGSETIGVFLVAVLGFLLIFYSFRFLKDKKTVNILPALILGYLISFLFAVKFEEVGLHESWLQTVFFPLFVIFVGSVTSKFLPKIILIVFIIIIAHFNLKSYLYYQPERDKYYTKQMITEVIREYSNDRNPQITGTNPQPYYYLLWYFEDDPDVKEKYYSYIKWSKVDNPQVIYYIEEKNPLPENESANYNLIWYDFGRGVYEKK